MALIRVLYFLLLSISVNAFGLWKGADPATVKLCDGLSTRIGNLSTLAYQRDVDSLNLKILKLRFHSLEVCKPDFRVLVWTKIPSGMIENAAELLVDIEDFQLEIDTYEPEPEPQKFELDVLCCFVNIVFAAWILARIVFKFTVFLARMILSVLRGVIIGMLWLVRVFYRILRILLRLIVRLPVFLLGIFNFLKESILLLFQFLIRFIDDFFKPPRNPQQELAFEEEKQDLEDEDCVLIRHEDYHDLLGYDAKAEFSRMGLPGNVFRLTLLNERYQLAPTYPSCLIVPKNMTDIEIKACAQFRSKKRFIAVTWKNPNSYQVIARSSQPLNGLWGKHQREDSGLVDELAKITRLGNPDLGDKIVKICDARPFVNALGNAFAGKGYEREASYKSSEIVFAGIDNIHVIRNSFNGILSLFENLKAMPSYSGDFESALSDRYRVLLETLYQNSGPATWIGHLSMILASACDLACWISRGGSILVHCSDGWDRTAQLVSLTQLLVDPYFRTRRGFCILIEKDWIRFGHQFAARYGNSAGDHEKSPIMIQWLDTVFQIMRQFPRAFEFNSEMLCDIADALYSCEFGTFLSNTEQDFVKVSGRTKSLWNSLLSSEKYLNLNFDPMMTGVLQPKSSIRDLTLFLKYFKRWDAVTSRLKFDENAVLDAIDRV